MASRRGPESVVSTFEDYVNKYVPQDASRLLDSMETRVHPRIHTDLVGDSAQGSTVQEVLAQLAAER